MVAGEDAFDVLDVEAAAAGVAGVEDGLGCVEAVVLAEDGAEGAFGFAFSAGFLVSVAGAVAAPDALVDGGELLGDGGGGACGVSPSGGDVGGVAGVVCCEAEVLGEVGGVDGGLDPPPLWPCVAGGAGAVACGCASAAVAV